MDTFVVRIRRSNPSDPGLRGVVDEVASGLRSTFRSSDELIVVLTGAPGGVREEGARSLRSLSERACEQNWDLGVDV
jgi:hypothetical protein